MNSYAYSVLAFGFCSFLIGFFVWLRLQNEIGEKYFGFTALAGIWGMVMGVSFTNSVQYDTALICARIATGAASLIGPMWVHFCLKFTGYFKVKRLQFFLIFLYLTSAFIFFNMFSRDFVPIVSSIMIFKYYAVPGWIYKLFTANFFIGVMLGFILLIAYCPGLSGKSRSSCLFLILATGAGFFGGALTFLPVYGIQFPQYGMWIMPFYPILMAVAIMRFDLFSIESFALAAHKDKLASLGILTASINHEIRAPLFMIRGTLETESNSELIKQKVLSQIDRLTGIVSRLTHFAKKGVEEAAQIEPVDLKEVLADIRPLFQHQLNYQQIEYKQEIPNDLPKVLADRRYLEEILFNLILNACQALKNTPTPKIMLSALSSPSSRGSSPSVSRQSLVVGLSSIVITIEDNGPGISPEELKHIFKPFHTTKKEGTGLGLYITKQLVDKCGGKIDVQSKVNQGTKFIVRFKGA